jgi:hypothetical protein
VCALTMALCCARRLRCVVCRRGEVQAHGGSAAGACAALPRRRGPGGESSLVAFLLLLKPCSLADCARSTLYTGAAGLGAYDREGAQGAGEEVQRICPAGIINRPQIAKRDVADN